MKAAAARSERRLDEAAVARRRIRLERLQRTKARVAQPIEEDARDERVLGGIGGFPLHDRGERDDVVLVEAITVARAPPWPRHVLVEPRESLVRLGDESAHHRRGLAVDGQVVRGREEEALCARAAQRELPQKSGVEHCRREVRRRTDLELGEPSGDLLVIPALGNRDLDAGPTGSAREALRELARAEIVAQEVTSGRGRRARRGESTRRRRCYPARAQHREAARREGPRHCPPRHRTGVACPGPGRARARTQRTRRARRTAPRLRPRRPTACVAPRRVARRARSRRARCPAVLRRAGALRARARSARARTRSSRALALCAHVGPARRPSSQD